MRRNSKLFISYEGTFTSQSSVHAPPRNAVNVEAGDEQTAGPSGVNQSISAVERLQRAFAKESRQQRSGRNSNYRRLKTIARQTMRLARLNRAMTLTGKMKSQCDSKWLQVDWWTLEIVRLALKPQPIIHKEDSWELNGKVHHSMLMLKFM